MGRLVQRRKDLLTSMMKDGIYEAAVAVLTRHGMEGMTMDRVAEEAGVAKGSLYNYFPNKLELLQFVHEKTLEPIRERVQEFMKTDLPAVHKLETMIRMWFQYLDEKRGLFGFLFNDYAVRGLLLDQEESARASAIRDLATIIGQGSQSGDFRQVDVTRVAVLLLGAVRQTVEQQLATGAEWPVDQMTRI